MKRLLLIRHLISSAVIGLVLTLFLPVAPVSAGKIDLGPIASIWKSDTRKKISGEVITFEVDKRANVMIDLPKISKVSFDYETDGHFMLLYTAVEKRKDPDPLFMQYERIRKGKGRVDLDFRRTIDWSPESRPFLVLEGTGNFSIKNATINVVSSLEEFRKEKNSALFWVPERVMNTSVNYTTPVYWDYSRKIPFADFLGLIFLFLLVMSFFASLFYRQFDIKKFAIALSLVLTFVYSLHFAVRFLPMINAGPLASANERIKENYFNPEFGIITAKAREMVKGSDIVAVSAGKANWILKNAVCFNLEPVECVFYQQGSEELHGLRGDTIGFSEVNILVAYNPDNAMPAGYEKIYELNKNVYIARKR